MKTTPLKPDVIFKNFWRENDRFASLFNTVVFGGQEIVKPEELSELDTDVSNVVELGEYKETLTRARDIVKRAAYGVDFVIMGIESQTRVHYGMPLRVMIYDSLGYLKECRKITRQHKKAGDKATPEEFLSGLHRDDRLHPIISIVIYYNEKPWDGPKSLKDLMVEMPPEISSVFSDYRMNLLEVGKSERYWFNNRDVQDIFEAARHIYKGEFAQVKEMFGERNISSDVGAMIGVMTDSNQIIEQAYKSEGGMNMCTALEKLKESGRAEGLEEGRTEGRAEGRAEGREEGRAEGKREMIFAFLKAGADIRVIKEASGLSEEEIEKLRKEMK